MSEIEFEGISSGNGGAFFWEVDKETYIAVMGEKAFGEYNLAGETTTLRIYAESLIHQSFPHGFIAPNKLCRFCNSALPHDRLFSQMVY